MQEEDFKELLKKYNAGQCSEREKILLESWYLTQAKNNPEAPSADSIEQAHREVWNSLPGNTHRKTMHIWRMSAAAAIILLGTIALYLFRVDNTRLITTKNIKPEQSSTDSDILPGGDKAILTLSDGSTINLDEAHTGELTNQGSTEINKTDRGELVYAATAGRPVVSRVLYNTVSTPRGGQYHVVLPDGTRVWLNAVSSIRFPTAFSGNSREVTLTGEAYFEVASIKSKPFIVSVNGSSVQVLGTHFNIMAYQDEVLTTTLLEGSVKVKHGKAEQVIVPGQAAIMEHGIRVAEVNTDNAIAWKNGVTVFTNSPIQSIMRQISRWYDLDVEYTGKVPHRLFTGRIPRSAKLSQVLKVLELSDINFKVKDKKIIVTP